MKTLRWRLVLLSACAVVLFAVAQAWVAYREARGQVNELFDYQMQQMAVSLSAGLPATGLPSIDGFIRNQAQYPFMVRVWTIDGLPIFGGLGHWGNRMPLEYGFTHFADDEHTYRVYAIKSLTYVIQIIQDERARGRMAEAMAWRATLPVLVLSPVLVLLIYVGVVFSLRPLLRVRDSLATRTPDRLDAIVVPNLPAEIEPVMDELNQLLRRLGQAFDQQSQLISNAAHELRSPLAALTVQAQWLARAPEGEARNQAQQRLEQGIARAVRMTEQLLTMSRYEAALAKSPGQLVNLSESLLETVRAMEPLAKSRELQVQTQVTPELWVLADLAAVGTLMTNLLDNAIRYTPEGGTIELTMQRERDAARISLQDSGPGIPAEDRERVMHRFERGDNPQVSGTGLGLAIVQTVAQAHGVRIQLRSSERLGGLRVDLTWPLSLS